ncbi:hypothetical protein Zmor_001700 [Zophobas morio]|uniref:CHK kinase-like domain-containing protein n=1 Tax=Zophobas morio TaxID=2755281 RepID=A0AA38MSV8_9CUCU|nr:hypothetical protein Zmor_001700 [Zophobas morio]
MSDSSEDELKHWLTVALKGENLVDFTVSRLGNAAKHEEYMGDIVFVEVSAETCDRSPKIYNLVLKCSKKSPVLRDSMPVKAVFENEMHLYENVIPAFTEFQKERGVSEVFNSVPKYYGSYVSKDTEVEVLENLTTRGYYLCNRIVPLPTNNLKLILREYGKFQAISAAMQDQAPEKFKSLAGEIRNVWKMFVDKHDIETYFVAPIDEVHELLKTSLPETTAEKLKKFKTQIKQIIYEVINNTKIFSVISHGDCQNNNFMFQLENKTDENSLKVAILDWQTTKFASPVMDISYFIYVCASKEDLEHFDELINIYYDSFSGYVKLLGSDPENIFPFSQFLTDFKLFEKHVIGPSDWCSDYRMCLPAGIPEEKLIKLLKHTDLDASCVVVNPKTLHIN